MQNVYHSLEKAFSEILQKLNLSSAEKSILESDLFILILIANSAIFLFMIFTFYRLILAL